MKDHPNLSPAINHNINMSESMGGWWVGELPRAGLGPQDRILPVDRMLKIRTRNTEYQLKHDPNNSTQMLIKGHARYCPEWTVCHVVGSTWGGSMIKVGYVGVGMHLEVTIHGNENALYSGTITTTQMQEIEECAID